MPVEPATDRAVPVEPALLEAPDADAAEQARPVTDDDDSADEEAVAHAATPRPPLEADPADVAEQFLDVGSGDEDDYR